MIASNEKCRWFRGQLHAHTFWSDGAAFPEQAIDCYRRHGYDFLCITDHNSFAGCADRWREVAAVEGGWPRQVSQAVFDDYRRTCGAAWVESRCAGEMTEVRLKTFEELRSVYDQPGKFLLLPGAEITLALKHADAARHVHLSYVNLPLLLPLIRNAPLIKKINDQGVTISNLIAQSACEARQAAGDRPYLLILNHPFWRYFDVLPRDLIDRPEILFFEVCNSGAEHAPHPGAAHWSVDRFWDTVNAFRMARGHPLLYGVGADDAHFYDAARLKGKGGIGNGWVMVRAPALTAGHLIDAMSRGDFYASNGVILDDVQFTPADMTLRVAVRPEQGVDYKIHFIATRRGFDREVLFCDSPAQDGRPVRRIPLYAGEIGQTVKTVAGNIGAYAMSAEDLFVRARVESSRPSAVNMHFHPRLQSAWTQPVAAPELV